MKRITFIVAVFILSVMFASAKDDSKPPKEKFKPRMSLGVNAIFEWGYKLPTSYKGSGGLKFSPIVRPGISFDVQLTRHSGIETGLYYRMNYIEGNFTNPTGALNETVVFSSYHDHRLLVPIYYKFYSRILNFAAGVDLSFNLDYTDASFSNIDYAFVLRLSKDFTIYRGLYVEPLLQLGVGNIVWWGVGVGFKYRF